MTSPINVPGSITPARPATVATPPGVSNRAGAGDFKAILLDSLNEVNRLQTEADTGVQRLLTGESDNVAEVLAAAKKAGIAFDLLMEVRNKLTEAYQEIKQMRI